MTARWTFGAFCLVAATPAAAQSQQSLDSQYLVQVRPGPKRYFYQDYDDGCPAATAKCRRPAYVLPGDLLVASEAKNGLTRVTFVNKSGKSSWGWIETAGLMRIQSPALAPAAWLGNWSRTEANIEIKPARRAGRYAVHGDATWGASDPERVRRGGINLGELDGEIAVSGGRVTAASGDIDGPGSTHADEIECHARMRLLGPYLLVDDNGNCGGMNVSFSGAFRK